MYGCLKYNPNSQQIFLDKITAPYKVLDICKICNKQLDAVTLKMHY